MGWGGVWTPRSTPGDLRQVGRGSSAERLPLAIDQNHATIVAQLVVLSTCSPLAVENLPRRGRRPRRTPREIRDEMIAVGLDLLAERGLTVVLDSVRFDDAIHRADVARASAYRAWQDPDSDDGPQVRFHDALAARLLEEQPGFGSGETGALRATEQAVGSWLERLPELDKLDPTERGFWLRQIHRAGSNANQLAMDDSRLWHCYIAVAAGLMSGIFVSDELRESWIQGEAALVGRYKDLYLSMADLFGFQLRSCYTIEQFDTAAAALAEGLTIRSSINPHIRGIVRRTGPGGAEEEWTLFAVCFEGLVRQFFEPRNDVPLTSLEHE